MPRRYEALASHRGTAASHHLSSIAANHSILRGLSLAVTMQVPRVGGGPAVFLAQTVRGASGTPRLGDLNRAGHMYEAGNGGRAPVLLGSGKGGRYERTAASGDQGRSDGRRGDA